MGTFSALKMGNITYNHISRICSKSRSLEGIHSLPLHLSLVLVSMDSVVDVICIIRRKSVSSLPASQYLTIARGPFDSSRFWFCWPSVGPVQKDQQRNNETKGFRNQWIIYSLSLNLLETKWELEVSICAEYQAKVLIHSFGLKVALILLWVRLITLLCFLHISHFAFDMKHKYSWQIQRSKWAKQVGWLGPLTTVGVARFRPVRQKF